MKTRITIILTLIVFVSCNRKQNQVDSYFIKEDSLLHQLTDSLITPDSYWRMINQIRISPPFIAEKISKAELMRNRDSLKQIWDSLKLFIAFDDTLICFSDSYHAEHLKNTKEYFKYNLVNVDSSFFPLFDRIVNDTSLLKRKIDIRELRTNYKYYFTSVDSIEVIRRKGFRVIERYLFSRIAFNADYTKACFYAESLCGGECGGGEIIFLERAKGIWRIIERKSLWVA